ncbi:MAG: PorT family protein [Tannerella sp.]|jgi:hypothetical protein|nr:PorT family protein [Tannerella sp.]
MMKRIVVIPFFIIVLSSTAGVSAQNPFQREWAIGASGGIGFSSVSFSPKVLQNTLIGYNGGITARWITEKNLGLQLEVNLKQQGWTEAIELTKPEVTDPFYTRKATYVDIPLLTHIYFGSDKFRFFVNLGPHIGFFLGESTDENLNGAIVSNRPNAQHTLPIKKKFEWGLGGGPGLEFRSRAGYFLLEGRYYYGLSDFYRTRREDDFSKASNQIISVKITYLIPISSKLSASSGNFTGLLSRVER